MPLTNVDLYRIDGTVGSVSNISTSALNGGPLAGARNRIINGDMRIDQRNAGAAVTIGATSVTYVVDRFAGYADQASKFSLQQSTVAPPGFTNSLLATSLSAYSVLAGDRFNIRHHIEGFNAADLAWGTASASAATLSFWVRSSLTGTFGGSLRNSAGTRSYPFTYSISSANTWEYKSITVPGETTGTWVTNNGIGITLFFSLGTGSTNSGTAGAWANSDFVSATGATSVVGTNGATFYITGVQLEAGTVATPFERRSYGQELALCQRYFCKPNGGGGSGYGRSHGYDLSTGRGPLYLPLPVTMRATPSIALTSQYTINDGGSPFGYGATVVAGGDTGQAYFFVTFTSQPPAGSMVSFGGNCTASAEL